MNQTFSLRITSLALVTFLVSAVAAATTSTFSNDTNIPEIEAATGKVVCKSAGYFLNPNDRTHRTGIRCQWKPVTLSCDDGYVFSSIKNRCVQLTADQWRRILKCPANVQDKFLRNPYDCTRFYRCYRQGDLLRLDVQQCPANQFFDEVYLTCLPIERFRQQNGECHAKSLPDYDDFRSKDLEHKLELLRKEIDLYQHELKLIEAAAKIEKERLKKEIFLWKVYCYYPNWPKNLPRPDPAKAGYDCSEFPE